MISARNRRWARTTRRRTKIKTFPVPIIIIVDEIFLLFYVERPIQNGFDFETPKRIIIFFFNRNLKTFAFRRAREILINSSCRRKSFCTFRKRLRCPTFISVSRPPKIPPSLFGRAPEISDKPVDGGLTQIRSSFRKRIAVTSTTYFPRRHTVPVQQRPRTV